MHLRGEFDSFSSGVRKNSDRNLRTVDQIFRVTYRVNISYLLRSKMELNRDYRSRRTYRPLCHLTMRSGQSRSFAFPELIYTRVKKGDRWTGRVGRELRVAYQVRYLNYQGASRGCVLILLRLKLQKSWEEGKKKRTSYHRRQGHARWYE